MFGKSKIFVTLAFIFTLIFTTTTAFADYAATAARTVPAYHDENLTQRTGNERVDQGDRITVHRETDRAYLVTYPTPRGNKTRWVPKNVLDNNGGGNRQQAMVDTARRYMGSGEFNHYCQRFVRKVGESIGLPASSAGSALEACNKWRVSTDRNIPVGATVYLRGRTPGTNGYIYGHVGIYTGNGNVIHALGTVKEQSLDSLLQSFDYLGWGWQAGVDLR